MGFRDSPAFAPDDDIIDTLLLAFLYVLARPKQDKQKEKTIQI